MKIALVSGQNNKIPMPGMANIAQVIFSQSLSGVFDGSFALSRYDARVQRYLTATERKRLDEPARPEDLAERRSVLMLGSSNMQKEIHTLWLRSNKRVVASNTTLLRER